MVNSGRVSGVRNVEQSRRILGDRTVLNRFCGRELNLCEKVVAWCVVVLPLALTGCGGESVPEEYSGPPVVFGAVSLDGVPLPGVTVSFESPEAGSFKTNTGEAGKYSFEGEEKSPPLGKYLVRITASADAAAADSEPQTLPARYNSNTELVVDVMSGQNPIDFPLLTGSEEVTGLEEDVTEE